MNKSINILDKEYLQWVKDLCGRYRQSQIKAAVKVNVEQLKFNWLLGRDIVELHVEERWGESVITQLSKDLREAIPNAAGLSKSNIYYCRKFYLLYKDALKSFHQLGGKNETELFHQVGGIFEVPWRHHCLIMDKVKDDIAKALFYVHQTVENGWSRSMLLNFISTDLYERQGKALTNFTKTLPDAMSDLAQELTKDPYNFAFTGITGRYNERLLKNALLNNITRFLVAPPKKVHKCFSHMKTLELEIVQGFFFYPHYAFRYIFVKLDFANSVAFFKAFEKAINTHHTSLFFSCLTIPISGVKK